MIENIIIRQAEKSDIDGLVNVLSELLVIENEPVDEKAIKKGFELLMSRPELYCIYLAEKDGVIVGMCQAQSMVSVDEGGEVAYIENVIVSKNLRSSGLGTLLMSAVEECCKARGYGRVFLLVLGKNHKGINFYERNGWKRDTHVFMEKEFV